MKAARLNQSGQRLVIEEVGEWRTLIRTIPYNRELGLRLSSLHESGCVLCLPYRADLVGDPTTGALHVGAIAALIDTTFGYSLFRKIREERGFATLDLRIDHLKQSARNQDLFCSGDCYRVTDELAFVRGTGIPAPRRRPSTSASTTFAPAKCRIRSQTYTWSSSARGWRTSALPRGSRVPITRLP